METCDKCKEEIDCRSCGGTGWTKEGLAEYARLNEGATPDILGDCKCCEGTGLLEEDMAEEELSFQKKIDELMED